MSLLQFLPGPARITLQSLRRHLCTLGSPNAPLPPSAASRGYPEGSTASTGQSQERERSPKTKLTVGMRGICNSLHFLKSRPKTTSLVALKRKKRLPKTMMWVTDLIVLHSASNHDEFWRVRRTERLQSSRFGSVKELFGGERGLKTSDFSVILRGHIREYRKKTSSNERK